MMKDESNMMKTMKIVKIENIEMPYVDFGKGNENLIVLPGLSLSQFALVRVF